MQQASISRFKWDDTKVSDNVEITAENRCAFLKEDTYLFRSVVADTAFNDGIHYWEIVADSRTDNELKVGVTKNPDFDLKTSFSDYTFGWAFYGVGQLRHCDGANGAKYGKSFKKTGTLGVFLDMNKGTLAF